MSLRPVPIHRYSIHHCHRRCLWVSVFVILSEWIAEEPRFVSSSVSFAIGGLLPSPISPSPDILVGQE